MGRGAKTCARWAYSLGYYNGDYKPILTGAAAFGAGYQGNNNHAAGKPLFNGNISNSTYAISGINGGATVGYSYGYDQLNRLKTFRHHEAIGDSWDATTAGNKLKEDFTYDGNGNILALQRTNQGGVPMDALDYKYERDTKTGRLKTNRLRQVADAVGGSAGDFDLAAGQIAENYRYDQIGNMIGDNQSGINNIDWSVYGKIRLIDKGGNTNIAYSYDPSGNRVSKTSNNLNTYYVRDAQGNNLAVYDNESGSIHWQEQTLYGSSRLGMWRPNLNLADVNASADWGTYGKKFFELSNHLGNVMAVINDKQVPVNGGYDPEVINSTDYYAFGGQMPSRSVTLSGVEGYRYGFNGKENDNEVKGAGNQQDYGMRIYDPRIGKFLSVDPLTKQYPELTPYQFASNSPIDGIDLDGLEHQFYMERFKKEHWYGTAVIKAINGADALVTVLSKTAELGFELLAQPHLNNKIKPENRAAVFPLTHDQNIKTLAVGGVAAPILAVGGVIEEPSNERKWGELAATAFLYRGLLKGKAAPTEAIKEFDNLKGSGSVSGVIELNRSIKSNKAFLNGLSESARDFVYDPTTQKFAMAGKNASGLKHYGLRRIIGAEEGNVVGGRIKIGKKGEIMTSQWSGTYGQNWTPEIATKFKDFMKEQTNKTINQSGNMKFNDGTK